MKSHSASPLRHSIRAFLPLLAASLVIHLPLTASATDARDPAERDFERFDFEAGAKLAKAAVELHRHADYDGAFQKIKEAMEILPPNPRLYHERAIILQDLGRYQEALVCFDFAVDWGKNDPDNLYLIFADRATLRLFLKDEAGAIADAREARSLVPADADPARIKEIAAVLDAPTPTPLGAIWRSERVLHQPTGDHVEVLFLNPDGKTTLHLQKLRKDGSYLQTGAADCVWEGDDATIFGVTTITGNQWRMAIRKPKPASIEAVFQISRDGQKLTLTKGSDRDTFTRVITVVESLDELIPNHRQSQTPSAPATASAFPSQAADQNPFGENSEAMRNLPEILKHMQQMSSGSTGK